jgi:quinol monooxygenase YgiN
MFARNVSVRLKPNTLTEFNQTFEKEVLPTMRKQAGFLDELILANENGTHVTAISLWNTREYADAYDKTAYPQVLKTLEKVLDGAPKVYVNNVIVSTVHKVSAAAAA